MFLWGAAVMSLVTFVVHTFIGGKFVARPLLADETLPKASKWLNYYCWHITTIMILFVAAGFAGLALWESTLRDVAFLSSLALSLSILSAWVALKGGIHPLRFPSTSLFAVTAGLGWAALILGSLDNTKRTIRIAWHITSLNWWGLAAVMIYIHTGGEHLARFFLLMVAAIFAVSGFTALILSKGAHLSWVFFLPTAGLTLYAVWVS